MRLAGYVTVTLMTFDNQSNGRRTAVDLKSSRICNHRTILHIEPGWVAFGKLALRYCSLSLISSWVS